MVRCGLGLYGYLPRPRRAEAFDAQAGGERLRPAMALKARVVAVRTLEAGERPSYGRLRPLPARSLVATVPIGYADGVPRALFDGGYEVLIGGVRRPLAGAVTMDQIVVDCGDDDSVRPGDEVVLLGRQGDEVITADDWAALLGTISYEVVCGVGPRMPRILVNRPDAARCLTVERPGAAAPHRIHLHPLPAGRRGGPRSSSVSATPAADLLFVGEGPGREEDLAGEPFVGRSGKLLDRLMWEEIGLTRAECYIANVVKCRPPQNRDPAPKEIEACRPYLAEQITLIDPVVIVTLGNFATKLLLETTKGIRELRGQVFERGRASLVPTYHPAYVLRAGGEAMAEMRADLVRAKRLMAAGGREPVSWPAAATSESPGATRELAGRLAGLCRPGDVVLLVGDLGAGKTVFAQGFAAALGVPGPVTSPTFALVRQYRCGADSPVSGLIHADVYRTGSVDEVADLALAELVEEDAVALVEWGDLAAPALGESVLEVTLVVPDAARCAPSGAS